MSDLFGNNKAFSTLLGRKRGLGDLFGSQGGVPGPRPGSGPSASAGVAPGQALVPPGPSYASSGGDPRNTTGTTEWTTSDGRKVVYNAGVDRFNSGISSAQGDRNDVDPGGRPAGAPPGPGMWRYHNGTARWYWWTGTGMSESMRGDGRESIYEFVVVPEEPEEPKEPADEATKKAREAEVDFRELMQPYLDALRDLFKDIPNAPKIEPYAREATDLADQLRNPTDAEKLEFINQAAISAGFWFLGKNGEVVADLARYHEAVSRSTDESRVPKHGSVERTELQQRQLRAQRRADVALSQRMFSDTAGESFGRAMSAVHEATAAIADADLRRQMAIDDQNFEHAMMSFAAEDAQLQAAINRGAIGRKDAIDRRERAITAQIGVVYANADLALKQHSAQLATITARVDAITSAAMTAMGIEETAQSVYDAEYDKIMKPHQDKLLNQLAEQEIQGDALESFFDFLGVIVNPLIGLISGGPAGAIAGAAMSLPSSLASGVRTW